ncbi:hypothetical protein CF392_04920 [Tamilnaduibacter salinus]|jgi:prophage regulatory protein|uniref:Helix-turn-helix domain-containing protein n=1 Tax=Tamilnaduibacter salinus TaxID=1484056 RepID=A0A2A2I4N2_9GAMM|nr:AlpA family phage regulatory protein [Tamilnaduibacter salinus]MEC9038776.1 AlpA family phage regulatory protein [Pseudomonadota bacterium]PAV26552.1 hypothetical protein CF392_04920 [Tamilnaduibacter salinus]
MYYNVHDIAERYGVARHTIWRWVKDGFFPRPYMLGTGTARWSEEDLRSFDEECATVVPKKAARILL